MVQHYANWMRRHSVAALSGKAATHPQRVGRRARHCRIRPNQCFQARTREAHYVPEGQDRRSLLQQAGQQTGWCHLPRQKKDQAILQCQKRISALCPEGQQSQCVAPQEAQCPRQRQRRDEQQAIRQRDGRLRAQHQRQHCRRGNDREHVDHLPRDLARQRVEHG